MLFVRCFGINFPQSKAKKCSKMREHIKLVSDDTQPSPLLPIMFYFCKFFESGLGSTRTMQLGHKEGGQVGGVYFLKCRKLHHCYY